MKDLCVKFETFEFNLVDACGALQLRAKHEDEIEEIWAEKSKNKELYNGRIVSLVNHSLENGHLKIDYCEVGYKDFLAQRAGLDLKLSPIGVSGITYFLEEGVKKFLVGKRSLNVTQFKGFNELVPSGSLEIDENSNIECIKQLFIELKEEANIEKSRIKEAKPFCLIFDSDENVYDIGIAVKLDGVEDYKFSDEYKEMRFVSKVEFESINSKELMKASVMLMNAFQTYFSVGLQLAEKNEEDARLVMTWRNDKETLKMSYGQNEKVWPDFWHEYRDSYFLEDALNPSFATLNNEKIAFLRSNKYENSSIEGNVYDIGINVSPLLRGKGLGTEIIRTFSDWILSHDVDAVVAEVKTINPASKRAFEKAGYTLFETGIKKVSGDEVEIYKLVYRS